MPESNSHYEISSDGKSATIVLQPGIGNAAWGDIEQVGTELLASVEQRKSSAWLIDLTRLEYMGSALVALLVRIWKAVQAGGGKVVVVCGDGMPLDVIRLAGLDKVWSISPTTADGYKTLGVRAPVASTAETAPVAAATPQSDAGFPILGVVSFLGALLAGGALAATRSGTVDMDHNLLQLGMFGGTGIAAVVGLLALFKESSWGRVLGLLGLAAGITVGAMGAVRPPAGPDAVPFQDDERESAPDEPQETTGDADGAEEGATTQAADDVPQTGQSPESEADSTSDETSGTDPDTSSASPPDAADESGATETSEPSSTSGDTASADPPSPDEPDATQPE